MRSVSYLQGIKELENLNRYALESLTEAERSFVEKATRKVESYIREETNEFLSLEEIVKLDCLWKKYSHLQPFVFRFNPEEKIPKVYRNRIAFIIWTVWRSYHLQGEENLEEAALAAAEILSSFQPPYPVEIKEKAIKKFGEIMEATGFMSDHDLSSDFWEKRIFPYLEKVWEFKWVVEFKKR